MSEGVTRRAALKVTPAAALAVAVPAMALAERPLELAGIDWRAVRIRMAAAGSFMSIPSAEVDAAVALSDDDLSEGGLVDFGMRHDISLDWMIRGDRSPYLSDRDETEIMRLFREWRALGSNWPPTVDDPREDDALCAVHTAKMGALEARASATAPQSLADYALKIIMADDPDGEGMSNTLAGRELVAEAYRIAGEPGWTEDDEADLRDWRTRVAHLSAANARALVGLPEPT